MLNGSTEGMTMVDNVRVGEVVEASAAEFVTQCHRLYEAPPLGTLVRCGIDSPVYGIVGDVATRSLDSGRRPMAVGENDESEGDIYKRNPQFMRLLSTEFRAVTVAHRENGLLLRYLPPLPPRIHAFVSRCDDDEIRDVSTNLDFLPVLLNASMVSQDDAIAAFLRQAGATRPDAEAFLVDAGQELAALLVGQLPRFNALVRRLRP